MLLIEEGYSQAAQFRDMLRGELDVYDDSSDTRVKLTGPSVELSSQIAVPLGSVHEMTTNAAKYGALSAPGGSVEVTWSETETDGKRRQVGLDRTGWPAGDTAGPWSDRASPGPRC